MKQFWWEVMEKTVHFSHFSVLHLVILVQMAKPLVHKQMQTIVHYLHNVLKPKLTMMVMIAQSMSNVLSNALMAKDYALEDSWTMVVQEAINVSLDFLQLTRSVKLSVHIHLVLILPQRIAQVT